MSRHNFARIAVSDHDRAREGAIQAAIEGWQESAELVSSSGAGGELLLDLTFSLSGGWPLTAAAKSHVYLIGKANGGPCRVGWSAWWIEDGGHVRVEWPADQEAPDVTGDDTAAEAKAFVAWPTVEAVDEAKRQVADAIVARWFQGPGGTGVIDLPTGRRLADQVASWRSELSAQIGAHELTVAAWDMDYPEEARLFTPDLFPLREPEKLLQPRDPMMGWLPRHGCCMFCRDGTPLRLVGYRMLPPDPEAEAAGIRSLSGRQTIAVCMKCQATVSERLAGVNDAQVGLYETDGNPMGALGISPTLPCMTCERTIADAVVVINDSYNLTACRHCVEAARPLDLAPASGADVELANNAKGSMPPG